MSVLLVMVSLVPVRIEAMAPFIIMPGSMFAFVFVLMPGQTCLGDSCLGSKSQDFLSFLSSFRLSLASPLTKLSSKDPCVVSPWP